MCSTLKVHACSVRTGYVYVFFGTLVITTVPQTQTLCELTLLLDLHLEYFKVGPVSMCEFFGKKL